MSWPYAIGISWLKLRPGMGGLRRTNLASRFVFEYPDWLISDERTTPSNESEQLSNLRVTALKLLGGSGWNEFVLLYGADNLGDLVHFHSYLQRATVGDLGEFIEKKQIPEAKTIHPYVKANSFKALFSSCFTHFGIDYQKFRYQTIVDEREQLQASISVQFTPGTESELAELMKSSAFAPPEAVLNVSYGDYDGRIDLMGTRLKDSLLFMNRLRHSLNGQLLATRTELVVKARIPDTPAEKADETLSEPTNSNDDYRDFSKLLELYEEDRYLSTMTGGGSIRRHIKAILDRFMALNGNPRVMRRYDDLAAFVYGLIEDFTEPPPEQVDVSLVERGLWYASHLFQIGIIQRSSASQSVNMIGLDTAGGNMMGIGRILRAVQTIPKWVYSECLKAGVWPGFVVADQERMPVLFPYGIINITRQMLYTPRWWWHTIHDVAHQWAAERGLVDQIAEAAKEGNLSIPQTEVEAELVRLGIMESFALWVSLKAMYGDDFTGYVSKIAESCELQGWTLDELSRGRLITHLTVAGYLSGHHQELNGQALTRTVEQWDSAVTAKGRATRGTFESEWEVLSAHGDWFEALREGVTGLPEIPCAKSDEGVRAQLLEGLPVADLDSPLTAVKSALLATKDEWPPQTWRANTALMLSLWGHSTKEEGEIAYTS